MPDWGTVAVLAHDELKGAAGDEGNFVDAQYSGKTEELRPIYDALIAQVGSFGDEVEIAPKRTYVSLRRNKKFGLVPPSTAARIDVGINLPDVPPSDRLEASGGFNSMVSRRVRLSGPGDIDDDLIGWLRLAYVQA